MVVDVRGHAYYLKTQNRRDDFITAFRNVLNRDVVADILKKAQATIAKVSVEKK